MNEEKREVFKPTKDDFKIGQIIYRTIHNTDKGYGLQPLSIKKLGTKYIYTDRGNEPIPFENVNKFHYRFTMYFYSEIDFHIAKATYEMRNKAIEMLRCTNCNNLKYSDMKEICRILGIK